MSQLQDDPKTVSNRIALHFGRAKTDPAPILHMNADALVIEYNSYATGPVSYTHLTLPTILLV